MARRPRSHGRPAGNPAAVDEWLRTQPSLTEMRERYPADWEAVAAELETTIDAGSDAVRGYVAELAARAPTPPGAGWNASAREAAAASGLVRRAMAVKALKEMSLAAAAGATSGKVKFDLLNGWVLQKLLFEHDLVRKPVSLPWFRLFWPLLWQRRYLMPLVQPKGIYCFYSKPLIDRLARMIGDRRCLEIAAGDGTLARFLRDAGAAVTATDDHSWHRNIEYSAEVVRQDARSALRARRPEAVICSWPPPGNGFERHVFRTKSVDLYIAINTRSELGSGDRAAYREQTAFELTEDHPSARLVLPPELDAVVHVFRRLTPEQP